MATAWVCGVCLLISMAVAVIHGRKAHVHIRDSDTKNCSVLSERVDVELRLGQDTILLKLEKNPDVDENAPLFVLRTNIRGHDVVRREPSLDIQGVAVYQDVTHGAALEVSCSEGTSRHAHLTLSGIFSLSDGNLYSLKRSHSLKSESSAEDSPDDTDDDDDDDVYEVDEVDTSNLNFPVVDSINANLGVSSSEEGRVRRSSQDDNIDVNTTTFNIDVLAYVNYAVYQRWYAASKVTPSNLRRKDTIKEIKRVITYIFNGINLLYRTAKPHFNIRLLGIVIEDEREREWLLRVQRDELQFSNSYLNSILYPGLSEPALDKYGLNGDKLLSGFWNWSQEVHTLPKNDHIMVFINQSFYGQESYWKKTELLGVSYMGNVCKYKGSSLSLIKYTGDITESHIVAAHELGHSLGAEHDATRNPCTELAFIMHNGYMPKDRPGDHRFNFSYCSQAYFRKYVQDLLRNDSIRGDNFSTNCLMDKMPVGEVPSVGTALPGQHYDVKQQCQMMRGEVSYFLHAYGNLAPRNVCQALPCTDPYSRGMYFKLSAADGTSCGDKMWCINAKCVYSSEAPSRPAQCVFGNSKYIRRHSMITTCDDAISSQTAYYCYGLQHVCCDTCLPLATSEDKDCLWGDNHEKVAYCDVEKCSTAVNGSNYYDICCETCAEYRKSVTTITVTTTVDISTPVTAFAGPWTPWTTALGSSPSSGYRGHYRLVRVHSKNGAVKAGGESIIPVTLTSAIVTVLILLK